ncbi:MAG TPA: hypothetical protein VNA88_06200 [Candidatus Kapabacteria bacterium]|jgi:hypothetical protein|nr:hypothetical protein [Candidatus Kapabacteria bacterium]
MQYTYKYPNRLQSISGRRYGRISVAEDHLSQTHEELMSRLGAPDKTIAVQVEVNATKEKVWEIAAGSISRFFSHHPVFAGLTQLNSLGSDEGGRFIVHRAINGCIFDRIGEILVSMPLSQYTVSDVEIADTSVSGFFPSLYTMRLEDHPEDSSKTIVLLTYTMLGVAHPWALGVLAYQANSIKYHAEQGDSEQ